MRVNKPVTSNELQLSDDTEIISTTDLKGNVNSANEDFINISGFSWNEIEGKNHNLVRHPDMAPIVFVLKAHHFGARIHFPFHRGAQLLCVSYFASSLSCCN